MIVPAESLVGRAVRIACVLPLCAADGCRRDALTVAAAVRRRLPLRRCTREEWGPESVQAASWVPDCPPLVFDPSGARNGWLF